VTDEARPAGAAGGSDRPRWPWLPPLIWAVLVVAASSIEDLQTTAGGLEFRDKLAHFGEYFVFGWLVARCFDGEGWSARRHFLWTLLIGAWLGTLDEFYQGFVPGRERDVLDLLADVVGTAAGWYFSREVQSVGQSDRAPGNA
jgi:VanZ family protein